MRQLLLIICRFPPLICTYHKFKKRLGAKKSLEHLDVDTSSMSCLHPSLVGGFLPICCCFRPIEMMLHNGTQDSLPAIENGFNPPILVVCIPMFVMQISMSTHENQFGCVE